MTEAYQKVDFAELRQFADRSPDDRTVGPARKADIEGRCTNCWGPVTGMKEMDDGDWTRIECRLCGRAVHADDAEREAERMWREAEDNIPGARIGRSAVYHEEAQFILKILPDMDRDKVEFEQRIATARKAKSKSRWLNRRDFPEGTPGYLYAQACALVSGLNNLPREMSAIPLSDFDFGEPRIIDIDTPTSDTPVRDSAVVPVVHRKPPSALMMARMGTAMVGGMTAAFACEVGMKAILMTRRDEAEKTHNLLKLYEALPGDSRERLEADFSEIADILKDNRHSFGQWRYFEESTGGAAMAALVNTERVWGLGKAARVIVDECVVAGLVYEIDVNAHFDITADSVGAGVSSDDLSISTTIHLQVIGHECAIAWDAVLAAGRQQTLGLPRDSDSR